MVRIVGVQRSGEAAGEFLLLQNQGAMRVRLMGHWVASDELTRNGAGSGHLFTDDVWIGPGQFIVLHSKCGQSRWTTARDGAQVYTAYAGSPTPLWLRDDPIHVLSIQHTYSRQREPLKV